MLYNGLSVIVRCISQMYSCVLLCVPHTMHSLKSNMCASTTTESHGVHFTPIHGSTETWQYTAGRRHNDKHSLWHAMKCYGYFPLPPFHRLPLCWIPFRRMPNSLPQKVYKTLITVTINHSALSLLTLYARLFQVLDAWLLASNAIACARQNGKTPVRQNTKKY